MNNAKIIINIQCVQYSEDYLNMVLNATLQITLTNNFLLTTSFTFS